LRVVAPQGLNAGLWHALVLVLSLALALRTSAAQLDADHEFVTAPPGAIDFDIPAQPLAAALQIFADVTQIDLFYESSSTLGRLSSPVRGAFIPEMALRQLLSGTGFTITSLNRGAITVLPPGQPPDADELAQVKIRSAAFTSYFALVQGALRGAFCRTVGLETENAELLIRLWIASTGAVASSELLTSTGSQSRDQAYVAALQRIVISRPPPAAMPQPVTLMMLPRGQRDAAACAPDALGRRAGHE
jgi:hypothetical protein